MILQARGINVNIQIWNEHLTETIVLLHGFTGTVKTWGKTASHFSDYRLVAIDLVGHGQTEAPEDVSHYSMEEQIEILENLFYQLKLNQFILIGYSLGGRVALSYTVKFPERIQQLILESASPGLKTEEERMARRKADEELAKSIEQNGLQSFVQKWENIPLFHSQKNLPIAVQQAVRKERLSQSEIGLANSLRGMGTGAQQSLWDQLDQLNRPVTLITGMLDEKFCNIAQEMKLRLPFAELRLVENVGHAIHVENPKQFATIVKDAIEFNGTTG